jgi:hypothetical protein
MSLDSRLWERLEARGVSADLLEMLVVVLELDRNGSWCWDYVSGHVVQANARFSVPARTLELRRVTGLLSQGHDRLKPRA